MRSRWKWGSAGAALKASIAVGGAALLLTACGGNLQPGQSQSRTTPAISGVPSGTAQPAPGISPVPTRTPGASPSVGSAVIGSTVAVGLAQNGGTVVLKVGQKLLLTLPRPNGRDMGNEIVGSSDESVLQLENGTQPAGRLPTVLEEPFRALEPGSSLVTVSGQAGYQLLVEVQPA